MKLRRHSRLKIPAFVLLLLLPFGLLFAGEGLNFMNGVIDQFEAMRGSLVEDFSVQNQQKVADDARKLALSILDIEEIATLALGEHSKKVTAKEKDEFVQLFHELMANRVVTSQIPKKKIVSSKIPIEVLKEESIADKVFGKDALVVKTNVPHKKIVYEVDFYLYRGKDGLKLYDIHIDAASTLLDFRNQFADIINKKGMKYLVKKLKSRLKQVNIRVE